MTKQKRVIYLGILTICNYSQFVPKCFAKKNPDYHKAIRIKLSISTFNFRKAKK